MFFNPLTRDSRPWLHDLAPTGANNTCPIPRILQRATPGAECHWLRQCNFCPGLALDRLSGPSSKAKSITNWHGQNVATLARAWTLGLQQVSSVWRRWPRHRTPQVLVPQRERKKTKGEGCVPPMVFNKKTSQNNQSRSDSSGDATYFSFTSCRVNKQRPIVVSGGSDTRLPLIHLPINSQMRLAQESLTELVSKLRHAGVPNSPSTAPAPKSCGKLRKKPPTSVQTHQHATD